MKLSLREKLCYGLGDTASNLIFATVLHFLLYFYTDVFGLTAAAAGAMFLGVRALDAVVGVGVGIAADRTRTRWGSFRPWLLWMALPLAAGTVLAFTTPGFGPTGKLVYAWLTYGALMFAYSAINIPYGALSGVMTADAHERTSLSAVRMACSQLGKFTVVALTLPLVAYFSGAAGDPARGYQRTMLVFALTAVALFFVAFLGTRERIALPRGQENNLRGDLAALRRNGAWTVLCGAGLLLFTFAAVRGSVVVYYFRYCVGDTAGATHFLILSTVAAIAGALVSPVIARRLGKKNAFRVCTTVGAVFFGLIYLVPNERLPLLHALNVLGVLAASVTAPLFWSMLADAADYAEWQSGRRCTGLVFSAVSFAIKFGLGLGGVLTGALLGRFGYVAGAVQSESTLQGIVLLLTLIPAAGYALLALFFGLYPLDEGRCATMHLQLRTRRAAAAGI